MNRVKWTQGKILNLSNLSLGVLRLGQIKSQVSVRVSRLSDDSGLHLPPSSTRRQSLVKKFVTNLNKTEKRKDEKWATQTDNLKDFEEIEMFTNKKHSYNSNSINDVTELPS